MFSALMPLIGAGISSAMSYFGGRENRQATEAANLQNLQLAQANAAQSARVHQDQLAENALTRETNLGINASNQALQREFAQHGIQWRVQDAQAAGIHPMAALGGGGATFSPAAHISGGTFAQPNASSASFSADTSTGNALGSMGQDISRALNATQNTEDRANSYTAASQLLSLEKGKLELELLKSQIGRLRQTPNPPMPVNQRFGLDGQGQTASVQNKAGEITGRDPHQPSSEAHSIADVGWAQSMQGYHPVPAKDVKERIEDNVIQEVLWAFRNNVLPSIGLNKQPPNFKPPPGQYWTFNPFNQAYTHKKPDFHVFGKPMSWY